MRSGKSRRVILPAFALVVAILGTASLMLFTTIRSLEGDRLRMESELQRQGLIIISTLESSARTGMMMRWGREQIEALVAEAALIGEIAYIGIFDEEGEALALQEPADAVPPWPQKEHVRWVMDREEPFFVERTVGDTPVFEVSRKFVPRRPRSAGMMRSRMGRAVHPELSDEWVIVLGLHRGPWEKILADGRRQTLLSFLVIVIAGSMALYIGIVLQNFFVVRRTLAEMETYAGSILRNMADGLISVDGGGKVAAGNAEAARILGVAERDLEGKRLEDVLPEAAAALRSVIGGEKGRVEAELSLGRNGEERPLGLVISPLAGGDVKDGTAGAVLLLRDLTELRRLEARFRESEKLAAVGQMAATVAHEIRNPLSSLKGFAQLFEEKFTAGSREAGYAGLMVKEVERLNRTISDLLSFSRPMELQKKPVNMGDLLRETAGLLEPDLKSAGQTIDLDGVADVEVPADEDQLRRVILNIMINAHQASGKGGRITVSGGPVEGEGVRFRVADSGPGIKDADAQRAFDPFFTTREKGSGLGLAIVRKIVELHGGTATIAGETEGAAVTVTLPS